ncbi:hypothetical protein SeKA_A4305 [Salmonella enterica subsp. enterica serovar Kentucky str. CVM29188]|nr:hypothetical protein SeKA_A4305 [Salmonella enterica subsp. enterica serovar Kentucky str. CVM29188]EDZ21871.1 hypothetical protein SeKB_A0081 [Salmonella enterica subsp. enterica serovar Kentucky str. CDC 191]
MFSIVIMYNAITKKNHKNILYRHLLIKFHSEKASHHRIFI